MGNHLEQWKRASQAEPCPICGKPDNCEVSVDGGVVWCGRVSEGSVRENKGGQFLHWLKPPGQIGFHPHLSNAAAKPSRPKRPRDWTASLKFFARAAEPARLILASELGVSVEALLRLGIGWHPDCRFWTIPERDGAGRVIGISSRTQDGEKKRLYRSNAGLTYAADWDTKSGPILLVEGASDTAALMTIGLSVVGRPSNRAGVHLLVDLLSNLPLDREIVVIGERDEKLDGRWPGRTGAIATATGLAEGLKRPIGWALPPDGAKDSRDWLQKVRNLSEDRMIDLFLSGIEITQVNPPVTVCPEPEPINLMSIEDWRQRMVRGRIESLTKPGNYLDRSPTGAGKSWADLGAIRHLLTSGGAA
jgi:hypothetical protein